MGHAVLVTGAAGFVGAVLSRRLVEAGQSVVGVDNLNDYYSVDLKRARLATLEPHANFTFIHGDISDQSEVARWFEQFNPTIVVHLAAQAGVRHSLTHPETYLHSNVVGFFNMLQACRNHPVEHLVYASSSSVYGANTKVPFEEVDNVDHPVSLYAATKHTNELFAHAYSHNHGIPATGLRFFTVYGPMGRPDMAYFSFADRYFAGQSISIFNNGDFENDLYRDFTYIDDIVEGIVRVMGQAPAGPVPHRVFNIGNNSPVKLMEFIGTLEDALSEALGRPVEFEKVFEPIKTGDVPATYASTDLLEEAVGFRPSTTLRDGLGQFARWYVDYYGRS